MHSLKSLPGAVVLLLIVTHLTAYAEHPPPIVDVGRLLANPAKFDGKRVRVHGYIAVPANPRDVWAIALYASAQQATNHPERNPSILISLKDSRIERTSGIKSSWVALTAKFAAVPTAGGGTIATLTEIRKLDELTDAPGNH